MMMIEWCFDDVGQAVDWWCFGEDGLVQDIWRWIGDYSMMVIG